MIPSKWKSPVQHAYLVNGVQQNHFAKRNRLKIQKNAPIHRASSLSISGVPTAKTHSCGEGVAELWGRVTHEATSSG